LRSFLFIKDDSFMQLNVLDNNRILNHLLVTFFHSFMSRVLEHGMKKAQKKVQSWPAKESRPTETAHLCLPTTTTTTPPHRHHHCP
jgi:hypothetical protein